MASTINFCRTKEVSIKNYTNYNSGINLTSDLSQKIKSLDRLIFGFTIVFLISLTNSIFLNQIGYFFSLLLILIRWQITKENKFQKTGLELPFILFLVSEFISALLSQNQNQAFTIFFKRLVLIPVVYFVVASADDSEKAKTFFKIYIGAAVLTTLVYIAVAYEHFIAQLYQLESRGPSPFQYVMTAGGLMSFAVIFLFAFLVNEKTSIKIKSFIFTAFIISVVALAASYTRAAWIGTAAGIAVILIIKRQWILISFGFAALVAGIFLSQNISRVVEFDISGNNFKISREYSTFGRAKDLFVQGDTTIIADYENGISVWHAGNEIQNLKTKTPVTGIKKWSDNIYAGFLVDTRVQVLNIENGSVVLSGEILSPGKTVDYKIFGGKFYFQDIDSGLTIYTNSSRLQEKITLKSFSGIKKFNVDSSIYAGFDPIKKMINVYKLNGGIPEECIDTIGINSPFAFIEIIDSNIFVQSESQLIQYYLEPGNVNKISSAKVKGINKIILYNDKLIGSGIDGKIYEIIPGKNLKVELIADLGFAPADIEFAGNKIFASQVKRNRILSIVDPYHDTNLERIAQWKTGWKILMANPFFGVGDMDLKDVYAEHKDYYLKENFGHLHNNYVHFLVILGFVGFASVIFMLVKILLLNYKIYSTLKNNQFVSSYSLGALAAFIGFLVSGLAEWNFGDQEIITMVWFTLGLNIAFYKNAIKDNQSAHL